MKIDYETSLADLDAYYRHLTSSPEVRRTYRKRAASVTISVGAVIFVLAATTSHNLTGATVAALAVATPVYLFYPSVLRHETTKASKQQVLADPASPALGPHTLEVTPDGVSETCSHQTLSVRWSAVRTIIPTADHLFIYLTSLSAIIIPLRSLSSETVANFRAHLIQTAPSDVSRELNRNA